MLRDWVLYHHPGVVPGNWGVESSCGGRGMSSEAGGCPQSQLPASPGQALAPSSCQARTCLTRWACPRKRPGPHLSAIVCPL